MTVWFLVIGILGLVEILAEPDILRGLNPWYGVKFFLVHPMVSFVALGTVVLAITGAEAVYADMQQSTSICDMLICCQFLNRMFD